MLSLKKLGNPYKILSGGCVGEGGGGNTLLKYSIKVALSYKKKQKEDH